MQTFFYSADIENFDNNILSALKIIFWIIILLISFLLYIKSEISISRKEDSFKTPLLRGPIFVKYVLRGIFFIIFYTTLKLVWAQLKINYNNHFLVFLWVTPGFLLIIEFVKYIIRVIKKYIKK